MGGKNYNHPVISVVLGPFLAYHQIQGQEISPQQAQSQLIRNQFDMYSVVMCILTKA